MKKLKALTKNSVVLDSVDLAKTQKVTVQAKRRAARFYKEPHFLSPQPEAAFIQSTSHIVASPRLSAPSNLIFTDNE